jgi:hypothetical protein
MAGAAALAISLGALALRFLSLGLAHPQTFDAAKIIAIMIAVPGGFAAVYSYKQWLVLSARLTNPNRVKSARSKAAATEKKPDGRTEPRFD